MAATKLGRSALLNGRLFVMPALVLISLFMVYPIRRSLWMSFQTGKGMNFKFGGFANIYRLTQDPVFIRTLTNTMIFLVIQVPSMLVLAQLLAVALNNPKLKGRAIIRTAIFLPCVTSPVAYPVLFKSMFTGGGVINNALMSLHLITGPVPWLSDPFYAKIVIILAITWRRTGCNMVFYLAALQYIDPAIYEVARIGGVPGYARFLRLTVPMLKPVILFTTVISTIGTLQLFDGVNNLTMGGPPIGTLQLFDEVNNITMGGPADGTLSAYIYNLTIKFMPSFGPAATVSYVIVVLVAVLSGLQFLVAKKRRT